MNNIEQYKTSRGDEVVLIFIIDLSNNGRADHAKRIFKDLERLERYDLGFLMKDKIVKKIGKNIYELIINWKNANYRILFSIINGSYWLTNIFYKKTKKTPLKETRLAEQRKKELELSLNKF